MTATSGLHHVTSISGSAQGNVDFYVGKLGLRLVKRTVNFDDPGTWHLYYGDTSGSPGTLITFFPWEGIRPGRPGTGEVSATAYAASRDVLDQWRSEVDPGSGAIERFGESVVQIRDSDGGWLELIGGDADREAEAGIAGFHSVTLAVERPEETAGLLCDILGFEPVGEEGGRLRFAVPGTHTGRIVDLVRSDTRVPAQLGSGSVHHVAFRARDDEQQAEFRERLIAAGVNVTPVKDRMYFRSIYFREPGGVLFEIATDPPGMLVDEPIETLGSTLRLPPWYESARDRIEAALPPVEVPSPLPGAAT